MDTGLKPQQFKADQSERAPAATPSPRQEEKPEPSAEELAAAVQRLLSGHSNAAEILSIAADRLADEPAAEHHPGSATRVHAVNQINPANEAAVAAAFATWKTEFETKNRIQRLTLQFRSSPSAPSASSVRFTKEVSRAELQATRWPQRKKSTPG